MFELFFMAPEQQDVVADSDNELCEDDHSPAQGASGETWFVSKIRETVRHMTPSRQLTP